MNDLYQNNRNHKRYKLALDVDAVIGNKIVQSTTRDICSNGVFINTQNNISLGDEACVVLSLPQEYGLKPLKIKGKSVRVDPQGVAVQFQGLSPYFAEIFEKAMDVENL